MPIQIVSTPTLASPVPTKDQCARAILTAQLQLAADIQNGVDITVYMTNDQGEILHNLNGQFLTEA